MTNKDQHLTKTLIDDANKVKVASRSGGLSADDHTDINNHTEINKGTASLETKSANTEHVNKLDDPARQPDRRDQQGETAFDEGVNDETVDSSEPKSEDMNDYNRYANIDNAQRRILNMDERDSK